MSSEDYNLLYAMQKESMYCSIIKIGFIIKCNKLYFLYMEFSGQVQLYLIRNVKQDKPKAKFSFDVAD